MSNETDFDENELRLALDHAYLSLDLSEYGISIDEFERDPWYYLRRIGMEEIAKQRYCIKAARRTRH